MCVAFTPINWAGLSAVVNWFFVMPKLNCIFKKHKKQLKENQRDLMEYVSEDLRGTEDLNAADLKADIHYLAAMRRHPLTKTIPTRSSVQAGSTKLAVRTKSALPMGWETLLLGERVEQQGKLFPNSGAAAITDGKKSNYKQAAKKRSRFDLKRKRSV